MCDYSLQRHDTEDAEQGMQLVVHVFDGQPAFCRADLAKEADAPVVCLKPGTELEFNRSVAADTVYFDGRAVDQVRDIDLGKVATFDQVDMDNPDTWHDVLRFPGGYHVYVYTLCEGQKATVLQLPSTNIVSHREPTEISDSDRPLFGVVEML